MYWRGSLFRITLFRLGGWLSPHVKRLGYQYSFVWWWAQTLCGSPTTGRKGGWHEELSPCPISAVTWLHHEQVPSRLQALGPAFPTGYQTIIRLIMATFRLQVSCNWTNRRAMWSLISLFQPPPSPWPGFPLGYQTKIHLVIAAIRLQTYCK